MNYSNSRFRTSFHFSNKLFKHVKIQNKFPIFNHAKFSHFRLFKSSQSQIVRVRKCQSFNYADAFPNMSFLGFKNSKITNANFPNSNTLGTLLSTFRLWFSPKYNFESYFGFDLYVCNNYSSQRGSQSQDICKHVKQIGRAIN